MSQRNVEDCECGHYYTFAHFGEDLGMFIMLSTNRRSLNNTEANIERWPPNEWWYLPMNCHGHRLLGLSFVDKIVCSNQDYLLNTRVVIHLCDSVIMIWFIDGAEAHGARLVESDKDGRQGKQKCREKSSNTVLNTNSNRDQIWSNKDAPKQMIAITISTRRGQSVFKGYITHFRCVKSTSTLGRTHSPLEWHLYQHCLHVSTFRRA